MCVCVPVCFSLLGKYKQKDMERERERERERDERINQKHFREGKRKYR